MTSVASEIIGYLQLLEIGAYCAIAAVVLLIIACALLTYIVMHLRRQNGGYQYYAGPNYGPNYGTRYGSPRGGPTGVHDRR